MTSPVPPRAAPQSWLAPAAACLVTAAAFWPVLGFDFVNWDDDKLLLANPHFRGFAWANLRWMLTNFHTGPYQPLSWLSYALDYSLWGMDPRGYHLTNLLLHAANAGLCAVLAAELLKRALPGPSGRAPGTRQAAAVLAALVFALHPLRAESVAWVTERRDVLAGFFYLGTLILYAAGRLRLALAAYALSLAAKGIGVSLPLTLLVLDRYPLRRPRPWAEKLPFVALAAAAGLAGLWGQRAAGSLELVPLGAGTRVLQALYAGWFYLGKTLWPAGLVPSRELADYGDPAVLFPGAAAFAAVSVAAWRSRERFPAFTAAWLAHLAAFLPVAGLWRFGPFIAADRYSYFICLPWALLAGGLWLRAADAARGARREALWAGAAAALALLGVFGLGQAMAWKDSATLWESALEADPRNPAALNNLGNLLLARGRPAQALERLDAAVAVRPAYADARHNRAAALGALGRAAEAEAEYRRALALRPHPDSWVNLALLLAQLGRDGEAVAAYQEALRLAPDHAKAHNNLAALLLFQGRLAEAERHFQEALRLRPGYEPALRGIALTHGVRR